MLCVMTVVICGGTVMSMAVVVMACCVMTMVVFVVNAMTVGRTTEAGGQGVPGNICEDAVLDVAAQVALLRKGITILLGIHSPSTIEKCYIKLSMKRYFINVANLFLWTKTA